MPVYKAVEIITENIRLLPKVYDDRINQERVQDLRLIDSSFFQLVMYRLTEYALKLVMVEFTVAKSMLDELEQKGESYDFYPSIGCEKECQLPLRYGLPCMCWLAHFYLLEEPVPANLFDPRWFFDGPPHLTDL